MDIEIEQQGEIYILRCSDRIVSGTQSETVWAKLDEIRKMDCRRMLADLSGVPAIGSLGIGLLVGLFTSVTKRPGGAFVMAAPVARVKEVIELTRLNTIIPLTEDVESGLALLRGTAAATS